MELVIHYGGGVQGRQGKGRGTGGIRGKCGEGGRNGGKLCNNA